MFLYPTANMIAHQKAANSYSGEREACVSKRNGDRTKGKQSYHHLGTVLEHNHPITDSEWSMIHKLPLD
jgi:hypothetical protein